MKSEILLETYQVALLALDLYLENRKDVIIEDNVVAAVIPNKGIVILATPCGNPELSEALFLALSNISCPDHYVFAGTLGQTDIDLLMLHKDTDWAPLWAEAVPMLKQI